MSSKILRYVFPVNETEFAEEFRGPIVLMDYAEASDALEIYHEYYEFEEPKYRRFRIYETGQTVSVGEYFTTLRRVGQKTLHVYEIV